MAEFWQWRGDLPTGSGYVMLKDGAGRQGMNTIFGDNITAERVSSINVQFQYNLSTYDVKTAVVDTGTATQSNHQAVVSTGTGVSASATIESIDAVRYLPGHEGYAHFTTEFSTPATGSKQLIGIIDEDDGFALGYIDTTFCVLRRKDGIDYVVNQSDFNLNKLDGSGKEWTAVDFTKGNVWRITYGWLGYASINFEVMEKDGSWTTFHRIEYPNNNNGTNIGNPVLPIKMQVIKTGGTLTADITLKTGSWNAGTVGSVAGCCNRYFAFTNLITITAINTLSNIFTIKNMTAFQTFDNKIRTRFLMINCASESKKIGTMRMIRNATLVGVTATYTYIDSGNSTIQYTTAAATISGGTTMMAMTLAADDSQTVDVSNGNLIVYPGDTITFAASLQELVATSMSVRWQEEF